MTEPTFTLDPEDLDPRKLQRLLWGVFIMAAGAAALYVLTARQARAVSDLADIAIDAADRSAGNAALAARAAAGAEQLTEETRRLLETPAPTTTTHQEGNDAA